jgi:ubiquinone/menaquinone biosynthesis C-methylase UbiE
MPTSDTAFTGSIPAIYDRCLGPLLFEPYAAEVAARARRLAPSRILETAAGTGIVTAALHTALPKAAIVATDLNPAMLEVAAGRIDSPNVTFQPVDAQALPFEDGAFDLVVCQFGVMFFPDRVAANAEACRVLSEGGRYMVLIWDRIDRNPASLAIHDAVAACFPDDPPGFLARTPFGYHQAERIEADLHAAGFASVEIETVALQGRSVSARDAATGMCTGSPLRGEIEARDPAALDSVVDRATAAVERLGEWSALSALIATATK